MNETTPLASDLDLTRRTALVLYARGICGAEQVVISSNGGIVVLCGEVESSRAKWQCIECCRHVAGVMRIVDQLHISEDEPVPPVSEARHDDNSTPVPSAERLGRCSHE